jgi:hypothetical protein
LDPAPTTTSSSLPYGRLKAQHPDYLEAYWRRLEAFYAGGRKLLGDTDLLREVFPPHANEDETVYLERVKRSFYIGHAGAILGSLVSALYGDPVHVAPAGEESTEDPVYQDFFADCSPPHGRRLPFNRLLRNRIVSALCFQRAWTLVDLPDDAPEEYGSLQEQEKAKALSPYAVPLTPFEILDWEEDEDGELLWVMRCQRSCRRETPAEKRDTVVETYTLYTRSDWTRYAVVYRDGEQHGDRSKPEDDTPISGDSRAHTFGRVPVARLELPDELWAMDKLESPVREHFNKTCAAAWFEYKCAFPALYEFNAPEIPTIDTPISAAQEDTGRSTNQKRGIGYVQVRGAADKAEYVSPDPGVLTSLAASTSSLKDEIYRVMFSLALAADNSAAALGRSGDSKQQDKAATSVLLIALGEYLRDHAVDIHELASAGRGDTIVWVASGADTFDPLALSELVEQAVVLEGVSIPSATFQRLWKGGLAKRLVAADASEDELRAVDEELEENITGDQFDPLVQAKAEADAAQAAAPGRAPNGRLPQPDDEDAAA